MPYPLFDDALDGFRRFAESQRVPAKIRFIQASDVVATGAHLTIRRPEWGARFEAARHQYERGAHAGNGVEICALAGSRDELFCYIYVPTDQRDAVERMIPNDVKYAIRTPLLAAHFGGRLVWWLLRRRERSDSNAAEWKRDVFGTAA